MNGTGTRKIRVKVGDDSVMLYVGLHEDSDLSACSLVGEVHRAWYVGSENRRF